MDSGNEKSDITESLAHKVIRGGMWIFALRILSRGVGFIRTIILARLLSPSDFGLLGIAMLSISTLETFSQTGFQAALIQKQEDIQSYLDTAWTISVIRGVILFLLLFCFAPFIANFFNSPDAVYVIRVIALSTLLAGLNNIGIVFFQKELEFNKQFIYEFSATLADLAVAISLAYYLQDVWALVFGGIVGNIVRLIMSYVLDPYRPKLRYDKESYFDLLKFGKWLTGSGILIFIATQGDDIIVGKIFGTSSLGLYQMAYMLSNLPATEITHVISKISFPAFVKVQNNKFSLKAAFLLTFNSIVFLSLPIAILIFLLIPEFTNIFLGDKWLLIIWPARLLGLAGIIRSISAAWGSLYLTLDTPSSAFVKNIWRIIFTFLPVYFLAIKFGVSGIALAVLCGIMSANLYDYYYIIVSKDINIPLKKIIEIFLFHFAGTIPFIFFIIILKYLITIKLISFFLTAIISICLYIVSIYFLHHLFKFYPASYFSYLFNKNKWAA